MALENNSLNFGIEMEEIMGTKKKTQQNEIGENKKLHNIETKLSIEESEARIKREDDESKARIKREDDESKARIKRLEKEQLMNFYLNNPQMSSKDRTDLMNLILKVDAEGKISYFSFIIA
jgi:hypothetical protein